MIIAPVFAFPHIGIRLAEKFRGIELLRFLNVHRTVHTGFHLDEIPRRLAAYPARRHIRYFRGGYEAVHVFVQVDTRFVPVRGNVFFQPHHLTENVARPAVHDNTHGNIFLPCRKTNRVQLKNRLIMTGC